MQHNADIVLLTKPSEINLVPIMYVLGIWDGHDAGAALVKGNEIIFAINEERLTQRKLEVGFPAMSIEACLDYAGIPPSAINEIALSTSDPAKTLTRLAPRLKEEYYLLRRRKTVPRRLDPFKKRFKYRFTELGPNFLSRYLSRLYANRRLKEIGFTGFRLSLPDHHLCHANAAARLSGFDQCLVVTLDGVGDGLSGSLRHLKEGRLELINDISSRVSLGIFFEHVTNLMNMRELEDEGKVMALADYAYPLEDRDNPMLGLLETEGLDIVSRYSSIRMFRELKKILWRYPSEQFAFMAQRTLEKNVPTLIHNALLATGLSHVSLAGGVFSNIKLNMKIEELDETEGVFVFPHMGDGGLALGAAIWANHDRYGVSEYNSGDMYLGPRSSKTDILSCLKRWKVPYRHVNNPAGTAAGLLMKDEIVLWFQGRMEMGPRALGNRSILARPDKKEIKDRLNLVLKKRVWYQPFCPSILMEDAPRLLHIEGRDLENNRFMTTAFMVKEEYLDLMEGVINMDGTCRPQFVGEENPAFRDLLLNIKADLGMGVVLNTSFNIHGEPIACSPDDAFDMFRRTEISYLFMEGLLFEKPA